jgi:hypothetical protein
LTVVALECYSYTVNRKNLYLMCMEGPAKLLETTTSSSIFMS